MKDLVLQEIKKSLTNYRYIRIYAFTVAFFTILFTFDYIEEDRIYYSLIVFVTITLMMTLFFILRYVIDYFYLKIKINTIIKNNPDLDEMHYLRYLDQYNGILTIKNEHYKYYCFGLIGKKFNFEFNLEDIDTFLVSNKDRFKFSNVLKKVNSYLLLIKSNQKQYVLGFDDFDNNLNKYNDLKIRVKENYFQKLKSKYKENNSQFYKTNFTQDFLLTLDERNVLPKIRNIFETNELNELYPDEFLITTSKALDILNAYQSNYDFFTFLINFEISELPSLANTFRILKAYNYEQYTLEFIEYIKNHLKYPLNTYVIPLGSFMKFKKNFEDWKQLQMDSLRIEDDIESLYFDYFKDNIFNKLS